MVWFQVNDKIKENEKLDKYLVFARELRKLWNMRVSVIAIVVDAIERSLKVWKRRVEIRREWKLFRQQHC